jgi:Uma2 family endonuclease
MASVARTMPEEVTRCATEADLLRVPDDGSKRELVDGEIRVTPAGSRHGLVAVRLSALLHAHVVARRLGYVFDSSTGFRLPGGNVRCPDIAFVAHGRLEGENVPEGFCPVPPDLAVEVLSPEDRSRELLDKVGEYIDCGVRLAWVIDPRARTATVYRSLTRVRSLSSDDDLLGEEVVPGFRCRLGEVV